MKNILAIAMFLGLLFITYSNTTAKIWDAGVGKSWTHLGGGASQDGRPSDRSFRTGDLVVIPGGCVPAPQICWTISEDGRWLDINEAIVAGGSGPDSQFLSETNH